MGATNMSQEEVTRAINAVENCENRIRAAIERACQETESNVGVTIMGAFGHSVGNASARLRDCGSQMIGAGQAFKEALAGARNLVASEDSDAAAPVNSVDHSGGGMPNSFHRLM